MFVLPQGVAHTDQTTDDQTSSTPHPHSPKDQVAFEHAVAAAQAQSAAESRSATFAKAGATGGGIMGAVDGVLIWGAGGFFVGAGVGAAVGATNGLSSGGLAGAAAGAPDGMFVGAAYGVSIGAAIGAVAMGVHGAQEGSGVGRDFGNAVWDVTHSGPVADTVASIAGAVWGFISK
jgi:hypothetical protein